MAIAKKPSISKQLVSESNQITPDQQSFISGAQENEQEQKRQKSKPVMLRVEPGALEIIDRAAKRIGLKRAAFILSSAVERAGRMERE